MFVYTVYTAEIKADFPFDVTDDVIQKQHIEEFYSWFREYVSKAYIYIYIYRTIFSCNTLDSILIIKAFLYNR